MTLAISAILQQAGVSQTAVYRACGLSRTVMSRIATHGEWPLLDDTAPARIADYLASRGALPSLVQPIRDFVAPGKKLAPVVVEHAEADPANPQEDSMLLRKERLTPDVLQRFNLKRSPFHDELRVRDDVFSSPETRYARAALMDCALNQGFVALVGESGSGKSTLVDELEQRIIDESKPVIVIRPSVDVMAPTERVGKTLKGGQIVEAIIRTLAPMEPLKQSPEARARQLREVLISSRSAGYCHLVVIEEAHRLPVPTLKNIKSLLEIKHGLSRLLGVVLIGQQELLGRLSEHSAEVREIVQRCEIIRLPALRVELKSYIDHKFARAGIAASEVLAEDVYDAVYARLWHQPPADKRGEKPQAICLCYPLAVNNLLARAMNAAAGAGFAKVTADIVAGV